MDGRIGKSRKDALKIVQQLSKKQVSRFEKCPSAFRIFVAAIDKVIKDGHSIDKKASKELLDAIIKTLDIFAPFTSDSKGPFANKLRKNVELVMAIVDDGSSVVKSDEDYFKKQNLWGVDNTRLLVESKGFNFSIMRIPPKGGKKKKESKKSTRNKEEENQDYGDAEAKVNVSINSISVPGKYDLGDASRATLDKVLDGTGLKVYHDGASTHLVCLKEGKDGDKIEKDGSTVEVVKYEPVVYNEPNAEWAGIDNIGNSCFANSVISVLASSNYFNFVGAGDREKDLLSFQLQRMINGKRLGAISGFNLSDVSKKCMQEFANTFDGMNKKDNGVKFGPQHDPTEFMRDLQTLLFANNSSALLSQDTEFEMNTYNYSDTFHSDPKSDMHGALELPVKDEEDRTVQDLIESFFALEERGQDNLFYGAGLVAGWDEDIDEEEVGRVLEAFSLSRTVVNYDEDSDDDTQTQKVDLDGTQYSIKYNKLLLNKKQTLMSTLPDALWINLKRFNNLSQKISVVVKIDETIDLTSYTTEQEDMDNLEEGGSAKYKLRGVICHRGEQLNQGHYYAYIRGDDRYFQHNDETVEEIDDQEKVFNDPNAYVLLYEKVEED